MAQTSSTSDIQPVDVKYTVKSGNDHTKSNLLDTVMSAVIRQDGKKTSVKVTVE